MKTIQKNEVSLVKFDESLLVEVWKQGFREEKPEWKNWDGPYFEADYQKYDTAEAFLESKDAAFLLKDRCKCILLDGQPVGMVSMAWEDRKTLWAVIGITIYDQKYWNKGIGCKAIQLWIKEIFIQYPSLEHIGLTTWSGNPRMMKASEKIGFKKEAQIRKVRYWQNKYYDSVSYGILREEWNALRKIVIRETTENDLNNVRNLWANGQVMNFVGFPEGLKYSEEAMKEWFEWIKKGRPMLNHYSLFYDGQYCGESFYNIDNRSFACMDIKIFPQFEGKGIASEGLVYALKKAFEQGATTAFVDPSPKNYKALKLYERLGFQKKELPDSMENQGQRYYELAKLDL